MNALGKLITVGAATLLCASPYAASRADEAPAAGEWQKHELRFSFVGFTTTYSCDGLADKLKLLLLAAGARSDAKSQPGACARGFGRPDKFASAYLKFYTLASSGANSQADAPAVMGTWRAVKFRPRTPYPLDLGDCELIEQFRDRILPMFSVRNLDNKAACVPHQEADYSLNFDSFAAVDPKSAAKGL